MLNAAIVGLGWWGKHIVSTIQGRSDKIQLIKAIDVSEDSSVVVADYKGIEFSTNLQDALRDDKVEAIILATPHSFHERQIILSANAGKHVFCEKPLALTRSSAERSINACKLAGVVLGVGHERRFEPAMMKIARLVKSGELGTIMHVEANFSHDKLANLSADNWRVSVNESPAAGMTATGVHLTDMYLHLFGTIDQVFAQVVTRNHQNSNGDVLSFHVQFRSGATGYFNSVLETPHFLRFCVFGSKAWVETKDFHHPSEPGPTFFSICKEEGKVVQQVFDWEDSVRLNFEAFADACLGASPYPFTDQEKLQNIAVFEAICNSVRSGIPHVVLND